MSVARVCEFAKPASLILDKARDLRPELIVLGARGRGRVGEFVLGSVSHRVAMHADCTTLIVKNRKLRSNASRSPWKDMKTGAHQSLAARPSVQESVDLTIVSVVQPIPATDPFSLFPLQVGPASPSVRRKT